MTIRLAEEGSRLPPGVLTFPLEHDVVEMDGRSAGKHSYGTAGNRRGGCDRGTDG